MLHTSTHHQNFSELPKRKNEEREKGRRKRPLPPGRTIYDPNWENVELTMQTMDANYGSRFQEWIRNEENLPASAPRLKRIANQYSFKRLIPAFSYIIKSWRIVNIGKLLKTLCEDWSGNKGHEDRGILIGRLTENWPSEYVASLVCDFLTSKPYILCDSGNGTNQETKLELIKHKVALDISKARFLKSLTRDYSLNRVKAVCSRLGPFNSRTGIPYANFRVDQPIATQISELESPMTSTNTNKDICVIDWQIPVAIVKLARRRELQILRQQGAFSNNDNNEDTYKRARLENSTSGNSSTSSSTYESSSSLQPSLNSTSHPIFVIPTPVRANQLLTLNSQRPYNFVFVYSDGQQAQQQTPQTYGYSALAFSR
ncbi:3629_t:CDS:2 [Ambispora leptoticha]|uniref:3629_t:CDS:1 n=1 Tax=Ambispora leptoticha TaxID=144679 RepID=A0A9N9B3Z7_9GLOM|nr:3629_t:CDS:2 [Ambispora leptoticha]